MPQKEENIIEMHRITKRFPGVLANENIDFSVSRGEIHALLGENGAGKSTLMNILSGLYKPDEGDIFVKSRRIQIGSPRHAIEAGIGMVHQHFRLVDNFSVAENITLGMSTPRFRLDMTAIEDEVLALSKKYGLQLDPQARIWQLSVGEQQRAEIVKMLYRGADVLILDEPTAVLTPQEARELFTTLDRMKATGRSIIFITHKLDEVMHVADRVTVLRGGRVAATVNKKDVTSRQLASLMVGKEHSTVLPDKETLQSEPVLTLSDVTAYGDRGTLALDGVSLQVRAGEILGIAGVAGNGQRELTEAITGLRKARSGTMSLHGQDISNKTPLEIIGSGVSYVPEDRYGTGMAPNLSIVDNIILKSYRSRVMSKGPFIDYDAAKRQAKELVERFQVKTAGIHSEARLLSGGNAQKLLLGREISSDPKLLVAAYPTRGLDIGAAEAIRSILINQRTQGVAILLISEDLDELIRLSDRIAIMFEGKIMGTLSRDEWDIEHIGLLMAGVPDVQDEEALT